MSILLTDAILADIDPVGVEPGSLRLDAGRIADRGPNLAPQPGEETINCGGALVLPGFVNGHTHLYSALATGMPPPPVSPRNFHEILKYVWWRLDQALDAESIEMSARIGAAEALRCGTTTLIDHHASPNHIAGSLDLIQRGLADFGLRGVLCYETTDRHGLAGRDAGLAENRRFIDRCRRENAGRFAGLVGAHASFTLNDDSLAALSDLASATAAAVHIHVAEDPCDENDARNTHGTSLIDRLAAQGLLKPGSIFAHGTHLSPVAVQAVNVAGLTMAHNPRSNMNNAVGYAPIPAFLCPVMLGTDGIGGDMLAEARAAWLIARHQHADLSPQRIIDMLAASARRASSSLGVSLGILQPGAAADIVITDYVPYTPITTVNLPGHLLFGLDSTRIRDVIINGQWPLRNRRFNNIDESALHAKSFHVTDRLWKRMAELPCPHR